MRNKTRTGSRQSASAREMAALARYRGFALPLLDRQIASMSGILAHRLAFLLNGDATLAAAAGRAWLQDAAILATMPAASAGEAHRKVAHLQGELDRWVRQSAPAQAHVAVLGMIEVAIVQERARWALGDTGATPHLH